MDKLDLRLKALSIRKSLNQDDASSKIINEIKNSKLLDKFNNIGIYYPINNEINLIGLLDIYPDKSFYLPITKDEINFVKYDKNTKLHKAKFNTFEPIGDVVDKSNLDIIFVPSLALNKNNYRIGYGKGYYDRYLKDFKGLKVGVNYKELVFDFEKDLWDIALDKIILG